MRFSLNSSKPAMGVAFLALLIALSGTAIALPGKNKVDKNDIKKNAIAAKQIKAGAVASSEAKNNSLKGVDINEGTLGQVPSALTAGTANSATTAGSATSVGGVRLAKVDFRRNATLPQTTFFDEGGLQLRGTCTPGDVAVVATSSAAVNTATIRSSAHDVGVNQTTDGTETLNEVNAFIGGAVNVDLLAEDDDDVVGQTVYQAIGGSVVVVNWATDDGVSTAEPDCSFYGSATIY